MSATETIRPLHYGKAFAEALYGRLETHFRNRGQEPPLTIGLFGAWGSGKTLQLETLAQRFSDQLEQQASGGAQDSSFTLPVFFNAWRHESEDHLIVPLLKTTQHTLGNWLEAHQGLDDKVAKKLQSAVKSFKNAALALAAGLKGKLSLPLVGELELDPKAMLEEDRKRQKEAGPSSKLDQLDALYYDFENRLKQLTGIEGEGPKLNLLFLIDDLDRCLPEKAVQMLESVKLFLDVPGCAFLLALDDEVIERGIAHRYRDYKYPTTEAGHRGVNPVSGHEYLEKIVHLPVHVPKPDDTQVQSYLQAYFPHLFGELPASPPSARTPEASPHQPRPDEPERDSNQGENETRQYLRKLIQDAVPTNPRKLNRVAELYDFWLKVAEGNGWKIRTRGERLTLLRLACLQLLAPELYRFGQQEPSFLARLEEWAGDASSKVHGHIEALIQKDMEAKQGNPSDLRVIQQRDEPLLAKLRQAQAQRSCFDPMKLIDLKHPCEDRLFRFYRLQPYLPGYVATAPIRFVVRKKLPVISLANPAQFIDRLLSTDPLAWRSAMEQEAERLEGRVLDETTFQALLEPIKNRPEQVSLPWLELLAPHLNTEQLKNLYKQGQLLDRLNSRIKSA